MTRAVYGSLVLFVVSLTACQPPASEEPAMMESEMAQPAGLTDEDRAAIEATTQEWANAARANDWEALAATYAEDALLMPPNHESVQGRMAVQAFFAEFPPVSDVQLENIEVEGTGDVAYVRGRYTISLTPEGAEPIEDSGKYLAIHRKQADGSWPLSLDLWNSDLPVSE